MEVYLLQKSKVNKLGRVYAIFFHLGMFHICYVLCFLRSFYLLRDFIFVLVSIRDDQQECPLLLAFEEFSL